MNAEKICPKCGKVYTGYPAISREDNASKICQECGMLEAIKYTGFSEDVQEKLKEAVRLCKELNG